MACKAAWRTCIGALALFGPALGQPDQARDFHDRSDLVFPAPRAASRASQASPAPRRIKLSGPRLVIPAVASAETSVYGKLYTVLEIANISDAAASYSFRLRDGNGADLSMPFQGDCPACSVSMSSHKGSLASNAGMRFAILPQNPLQLGWAEIVSTPEASISVSAMLYAEGTDGTVGRAGIPPTPMYRRAWLYNDNSSDFTTTLIMVNPSTTEAQTFEVKYRDFSNPDETCNTSVQVPVLGQAVVETGESLACSSEDQGLIEISGQSEFTGIAVVSHDEDGTIFTRPFFEKSVQQYSLLEQWTVTSGTVTYGSISSAGCVAVSNTAIDGVMHTVHTSKWQKRANENSPWTDVPGTNRTGMVCAYTPTASEPGQYRAVAEISIGGKRGMYASNTVAVTAPVTAADLVVASASVGDDTLELGQSFDLMATTRNAGNATSAASTLRFYLSTDSTISTGDTQVGTVAVSALSAAGTSSETTALTAPPTAGTYYYGACVDSVSGESDTGNNCSSAVRVTVAGSQMEAEYFDLVVGNDDPDGIAFANDRFYVVDSRDDKVYAYLASGQRDSNSDFDLDSNNSFGTGIAFATDKFYVVDWSDDKVYVYLASGERDSASDFDLDSSNGNPHGIVLANNRLHVVDERDDKVYAYLASGQRDSNSDFDLDSSNGSPLGITFANNRFHVVDAGDLDWVYAYLSSGQRDSNSDFHLDSTVSYSPGITFANGKFYVVYDKSLNSRSRDRIYVVKSTQKSPELQVLSFAVRKDPESGSFYTSGTTVVTGASFGSRTTVRNRGTSASTATTLRFYRSDDRTISASDTEVGTVAVSALSSAGTSSEIKTFTAPLTAGTYYYGACVDSVSGESDTENNCSRDVRVTVKERVPDLMVESPSVSDTTPASGGSFVLSATVRNQGTSASTATTLRFYRSDDRTISASDSEVGTVAVSALSIAATSSGEITLAAPTAEGTYYYGACVDSVSRESNTKDNCSSPVAVFGGGPFPPYDLDITRIILHSPGIATIGRSAIAMTVDVTNQGPNASKPAKLRFSGGSSFDLDIPVLQPNETKTYSRQKVGTASFGTTRYRACIADAPGEENTQNNCKSRSVSYSLF